MLSVVETRRFQQCFQESRPGAFNSAFKNFKNFNLQRHTLCMRGVIAPSTMLALEEGHRGVENGC